MGSNSYLGMKMLYGFCKGVPRQQVRHLTHVLHKDRCKRSSTVFQCQYSVTENPKAST